MALQFQRAVRRNVGLGLAILLTAAGCTALFSRSPPMQLATPAQLHPGALCQLDMVLPPTAGDGAYHRYSGIVNAVTAEAIVLDRATEERCIFFGTPWPRPAPTVVSRPTVQVPLLGIAEVWMAPGPSSADLPSAPDPAQAKP